MILPYKPKTLSYEVASSYKLQKWLDEQNMTWLCNKKMNKIIIKPAKRTCPPPTTTSLSKKLYYTVLVCSAYTLTHHFVFLYISGIKYISIQVPFNYHTFFQSNIVFFYYQGGGRVIILGNKGGVDRNWEWKGGPFIIWGNEGGMMIRWCEGKDNQKRE